jgi:hypothetical protein
MVCPQLVVIRHPFTAAAGGHESDALRLTVCLLACTAASSVKCDRSCLHHRPMLQRLMQMCYLLQWVPELTRMGVCTSLANLEKDPSQNVRRTASSALALFSKQDAEAMACDNE